MKRAFGIVALTIVLVFTANGATSSPSYLTGEVERVTAPPAGAARPVYTIVMQSGEVTYTADYYAARKEDYPSTLHEGQQVQFLIKQWQGAGCNVHGVTTVRWFSELILKDGNGKGWRLQLKSPLPDHGPVDSKLKDQPTRDSR
ncbi:MAG TPA: hypothetical protein VMU28_07270 [Terriglobales bacterium]|nr:hypothetical protein [Terriglobales bacterium]